LKISTSYTNVNIFHVINAIFIIWFYKVVATETIPKGITNTANERAVEIEEVRPDREIYTPEMVQQKNDEPIKTRSRKGKYEIYV